MKILFTYYIKTLILVIFFSLFLSSQVLAAPPANFQTTQIIGSGLDVTTAFDFAPDGRIFILERTGKVKIYKNGNLLPTPFTQFNSIVTGDRGLLGITFDPDFANNHFVYFYYTGNDAFNYVARLDASTDVAAAPATIIYKTTTASFGLHIGGTIRFGADGKLYISIGDNGTSTNAQDLSNPFGKILRINKDGSIPLDNPFVGQSGALPEIWAYGLRNPFRFQFDSTTGRLHEGDVGDDLWEEINLVTKGANYGWPTCEGSCSNINFKNPIYSYPHNGVSSSVTGGLVYRGNMFPSTYQGKYFFGDYAQGFIKTLTLDSNGNATSVADFDLDAGSVVDLKVAPDDSIYYITYIPARLYRITHSSFNQTPTAKASADKTQGLPPLTVNFSSAGSFDPENKQLTFSWNFGDGTSSTQPNPSKTYTNKGKYTIQLTVSDGVNSAQASPIVVQVGTPPTVVINSPVENSTYKAGDTISYSGSGTSASGTPLPDNAFSTEIVFHHDTHIHPFLGPIQSKSGQFTIPTIGEPSPDTHYEIKITGTDSDNLSTTKSVSIFPQKVNLSFSTNPQNLQILLDGSPTDTPVTIQHIIGFQRTISVPVMQDLNGKTYIFSSWSDSGGVAHQITAPSTPATYTANFTQLPSFKAEFFNDINLSGSPVLTRQDQKIDFDWGAGSPGLGVNANNFSARWTNSVAFAAGKYRFLSTTDDGVRLYIDDQLVIDKWIPQVETTHYADVDLTSGNHLIKMEFYDVGGEAVAKLNWELLPNQLQPTPPPTFKGYKGEYWNTSGTGTAPTIPTTAPNLTRDDSVIDFVWGVGSPDPAITTNNFVTRWTKEQNFEAATYRFTSIADDGVRVYIDDQLLIDKWIDQPPTEYAVDKALTAGNHNIRLEYYENAGDATAKFSFTKIATPPPSPPPSIQGLTGEYFDNANLTGLKLKRVDPTVNFYWGVASPDSSIEADSFSTRLTGQVQPQFSETYTFYTHSDDGVRLWVNNKLIIDNWTDHPPVEDSGQIQLSKNVKVDIKMEFYENAGDAMAKLFWSSPSTSKQIIPQSQLFTSSSALTSASLPTGLPEEPTPEPTPAPTPEPIKTPQPTPVTSNPSMITSFVTVYGWPDNTPPSADIAYPGFPSTIHKKAGGTGTYNDPITFASDPKVWPAGTIMYIPYMKKYVIMEDICGGCANNKEIDKYHIDVWMESNATNVNKLLSCENSWTRPSTQVEVDPPPGRLVDTTPFFDTDTGTCLSPS